MITLGGCSLRGGEILPFFDFLGVVGEIRANWRTLMKTIRLKNGTTTECCLACKRSWDEVVHAAKGLCRGCKRKSEYKNLKIDTSLIKPLHNSWFEQLEERHKSLLLIEKTEQELGVSIASLSFGSTKNVWHRCPVCNEPKQTPLKLFLQNKNISHKHCKAERARTTNYKKYGVSNPLNTSARIQLQQMAKDEEIVQAFTSESYKVEGLLRHNNEIIVSYKCPVGHKHTITWKAWKIQGQRCFFCKGHWIDPQEIISTFQQAGYQLVTPLTEYVNNLSPLEYLCPKGHRHITAWKYWQRGCRCPSCVGPESRGERELYEFFAENAPIKTKQVISPYELDLYFEKEKLAVEYCGLYWHSELHERITPNYHYNKMKACNEKGIRLITLFEDEWLNNKELCISRIKVALGAISQKRGARECSLLEIDKQTATAFLQEHHLQGSSKCEFAIGLFLNGELVSVMTLGKPSRAHVSKEISVCELKRFATRCNLIIVGGAAKMFKLAKSKARATGYNQIRSYCDMRWGTGNVYQKLGMTLLAQSKYTPHYTNGVKRFRNQAFASKDRKTEAERVREAKVYRIYDCGHQTWIYNL